MESSCSTVYYQYYWKWKEWGTLVLTFVNQIDDCVNTYGKKNRIEKWNELKLKVIQGYVYKALDEFS